jgi:hypothetical protein
MLGVTAKFIVISVAVLLAGCDSDPKTSDPDAGPQAGGSAGLGGHSGKPGGAGNGAGAHGGTGAASGGDSNAGHSGDGDSGEAGSDSGDWDSGSDDYSGPSVGTAKRFAALAYSQVTTANDSTMVGDIGVSAAAVSSITGFDGLGYHKYGSDSLSPNDGLTGIAQGDVTVLVGNINPRECDENRTSVPGGLTGDITLHPGVTCMDSFSDDVLLNGHVYLDAGGDPNAFFIIRGNKTMTVADGAQVVLMNDARACGVFWRIAEAVTIGTTVQFHGTIIAGTAITMQTSSTLTGRALAQTAGVQLDANIVTAPSDEECPHVQ